MQVFNLSVLPGTAFRQDAQRLGLVYQNRPPYYVLRTPTLQIEQLYSLMEEAQEAFGIEFDPFPPPVLPGQDDLHDNGMARVVQIDLDSPEQTLPPPERRAQTLTLWFRGVDLDSHVADMVRSIEQVLADGPHSTLQIFLEPAEASRPPSLDTLEQVLAACFRSTSYLDLYYSLHPNCLLGAKRLIVLLPAYSRSMLNAEWLERSAEYASVAWHGSEGLDESEWLPHEHAM
jgi:hypothetical protein